MPSNHLILCCPLLLLPSIFPSIRVFSNESALLIKWPKYWSFSISPSNEYPGLISFRIDCFDLLVFQGAFRYFNMSVPPSRLFWFGKKRNPMIVSCIWTVSYWRWGCGQDHQILLGIWGGACTHHISFIDNYLLKVCLLNTLHSSDTKLLCWLYTKVGLWNFVQFFTLSFFTPLTPA